MKVYYVAHKAIVHPGTREILVHSGQALELYEVDKLIQQFGVDTLECTLCWGDYARDRAVEDYQ